MTLDLGLVAGQLGELAAEMGQAVAGDWDRPLHDAYTDLDDDDLRERLTTAKTSWLLARTGADYRARFPAAPLEGDFAVVASDGSFILPDRHSPARFYLINIGKVLLRYGTDPHADLSHHPNLYFREEELFVPGDVRRVPVDGTVLGLKRATEELKAVAERALDLRCPTLALQDGTLILWAMESQPDAVKAWVLEPFVAAMSALRDANVPVAAFISAPGSRDLVNTLRVSICDYPAQGRPVNCDHCRARIATEGHTPACDVIPEVTDRYIFEHVAQLEPGERSQVFASSSKILERYPPDFAVMFFYMNTGSEIARVEVPRWVAEDADLLRFTQSAIYDQCERGRGYPSALQEAHEQAVIRGDERRAVESLLEEALYRHQIMTRRSGKDGSKRGRFV